MGLPKGAVQRVELHDGVFLLDDAPATIVGLPPELANGVTEEVPA